ncbi:MAG: nitroreductase family protein [Pleomorphochaeta sp.]
MDIINNRRSVRKFLDKKVEDEKLITILKAAMQAPSACNQQPWEFIVVENSEKKEALSKTSPHTSFAKNASSIIVVLSKKNDLKAEKFIDQDLGACIENLLLETVNLNLGATWMGIYPIPSRVDYVKNVLDINKEVIPFALIAIGYPLDNKANKFINRFDESRIKFVK